MPYKAVMANLKYTFYILKRSVEDTWIPEINQMDMVFYFWFVWLLSLMSTFVFHRHDMAMWNEHRMFITYIHRT